MKIIICTLLYIAISFTGTAQYILSGKVISALDSLPLPGVALRIEGGGFGTNTGPNGRFTITLPDSSAILIVTHLGFQTRNIKVDTLQQPFTILLKEAATELKQVIVSTGYQTLPHVQATGSFTHIDNQLLNRRVSTDVLSRIEDVTPGLNVDQRSRERRFDIRGRSTIFANDQPLIVLDNFPYDGDISNINPNDIESITVLKDAAAASIWGVRAGNGVIVITTKKGRYDQPATIEFNSNMTIGERPDLFYLPWMTTADFVDVENFLFEQGFYQSKEGDDTRPALSEVVELLIAEREGLMSSEEANAQIESLKRKDVRYDISEYLYRPSISQQYAINLHGGTERHRYFLSAGYDKNLKNLSNDDFSRVTLRAESTVEPIKNLELNLGILYTNRLEHNNGLEYTTLVNSPDFSPYTQLADEQGNPLPVARDYRTSFVEEAKENGFLDWQYRPLDEIADKNYTIRLADVRVTTAAKYRIIPALTAELRYQYQYSDQKIRNLQRDELYYTRNLINQYTQPDGSRAIPLGSILDRTDGGIRSHTVRGQLNFDKNWQAHRISAIAGTEMREITTTSSSNRAYGYNDNNLTSYQLIDYSSWYQLNPGGGYGRLPVWTNESHLFDAAVSYYANAAYTYRERYTLSASTRYDQSNLFGVKANQKGVPLWSAGLGWDIGRESFYQVNWLPYLKIRATYGYNGNVDKNATAFITARYESNAAYSGLPYVSIMSPPNPELRWEKVRILNFGLDFGTRTDRVAGTLEYYSKKGIDLIGNIPVHDATTGIADLTFRGNVAEIKGSGLDLTVHSKNINNHFKWESDLLLSYVADKVTKYLQQDLPYLGDASVERAAWSTIPVEGRPVFSIFSYRWGGLDPETGDPQGYTTQGEISKDYNALMRELVVEDLVYHGPSRPPIFGSLRNSFSYKNFSVSTNITYRFGHYFKKPTLSYYQLFYTRKGHQDFARRWKRPGDELHTDVPSMIYPINTQQRDAFYSLSEINVEKADIVRLQDIQISYSMNRNKWRRLPVKNLQIYMYMNNLGILWRANDDGIDPDFPGLKLPRTFAFGIKADL